MELRFRLMCIHNAVSVSQYERPHATSHFISTEGTRGLLVRKTYLISFLCWTVGGKLYEQPPRGLVADTMTLGQEDISSFFLMLDNWREVI